MSIPANLDLSLLFDGLSDAAIASDAEGRIVFVNQAAAELFGWSPAELAGQHVSVLLPEALRAAHATGFQRYVSEYRGKLIGHTLRLAGLRRDGAELELELSLSVYGSDEQLVVAVLRDLRPRVLVEGEAVAEGDEKDRLAFLAQAGAVLDASLDYAVTLERVARLAVPRLADYCLVDILEDGGEIRRVATAHRDPEKERLLRATEQRYLAHETHPAVVALRTGAAVVQEGITDAAWSRIARDDEHLRVLQALAPHSWMFLPLTARSRALGTVAFVLSEPGRRFSSEDKVLAQELVRRAALAVDNARLYSAERSQRERLFAVFTHVPAAIAIVRGPDFRYELSNPMNQQLVGGRQLVGKTVREALPELEAQGLRALLAQVYRTGEPYVGTEVPVTFQTPEGARTMYMNGVYQPLFGADGSVEGVMAFAYEVTDQFLARRKVEEAERLFRTLTTHAPVGIFLTNADGDCEFVNPRWLELAGLSVEQATGKGWSRALHPEDQERVFREWYEAAQAERAFESRYRFRTPDGRVSWVQGTAVALRDPNGAVTGYLGTVTDITERQKAEAERERLLSDLQLAIRQRDDFLSIAAHELRTPLTTLGIYVEMLKSTPRDGSPAITQAARNKLDKIERQVAKLEDLIRTLLDVSRITQGRLGLRREEMDLAELVRDVTERFAEEAEEAGCPLQLTAAGPVHGRWDRTRLDQVVTNLLTNAIKYGRGKPIDVAVCAVDNRAELRIVDHGIGILPADRMRVFERFERAVSSRHYGGLGLGLWIARQILDAHEGSIAVEETPGGGATFEIELPR